MKRILATLATVAVATAGLATAAVPAWAGVGCTYTYCGSTAALFAGETLGSGDWITSPNKVFSLTMQLDSNLAMSDAGHETHWTSNTSSAPDGAWLSMQSDGNLVMYRAGGTCQCAGDVYWASGTAGHPGAHMTIQNDGNVVIYDPSGTAVWASGVTAYTSSMGATQTAYAKPDNGTALGTRSAGSAVHIWCQTNVGAATGHPGKANHTWDHLAEGGWVPDYYVNTPVVGDNGYSSGVPRCHRSGPLTVTAAVKVWLALLPGTTEVAWRVPGAQPNFGPLFNDGGDYWQGARAESIKESTAGGNCQDLVLANNNFWWLWQYVALLNNVDRWGPASSGPSTFGGVAYPAYGRVWDRNPRNPQVGDVVVFGHNTFTPSGHVASVVAVDSVAQQYVVAEMHVGNPDHTTGHLILDLRRIPFGSYQNNVVAFIR